MYVLVTCNRKMKYTGVLKEDLEGRGGGSF